MNVLSKGCSNMKQPKFALGALLKAKGEEVTHQTIVGYVVGVKQTIVVDSKTRDCSDVFAYLLSGQPKDWYYETGLEEISK